MKAVYSTRRKFKCSMFTMIFKTGALREKFPGGVRKFGKTHAVRYNREIVVFCDMGGTINDIIKKMSRHRLVYLKDYFVFDASGHLGIPWVKDRHPIEFQVDWLQGFVQGAGTMVFYREAAPSPAPGPDREPGGRKLLARTIF